jgi:hypothetical protein
MEIRKYQPIHLEWPVIVLFHIMADLTWNAIKPGHRLLLPG